MDIRDLEKQVKKDFNNSICLIGIIPFAVFIYILAGRIGSFRIFAGEIGYIIFITMTLLLLGIVTGRKMLWAVIRRLFEFNQEIVRLQADLIDKNRLAAITETTLALSHEINNPLMIIRGNLEMIEDDFSIVSISDNIKSKFIKIKSHCERIRQITDKLTHLSKPSVTTIHGDTKMIDAQQSI